MLRFAPLLFLLACSSKPDAAPATAPTSATATASLPTAAPAPTPAPAPAPEAAPAAEPMPAPSSEPVPAEPAVEPKLGPVPKLVWPQLTKGLPQTYAELRALLPPDHELVFVPLWSPDHGKSKEEVIASAFKDVVRHDFDGNGKPDLMFVMEALPSADDEPGDRTLVAFMQGADGQLTRALEVRGLVHGAFSGDIDSFEGLKLEGERVSVAQSFGTGREASSTHHEIAYRDGDFYFVGYGSGWNDDAPNNEFYTWSSNYLDLVAGTGKSSDGLRDTTDVPLKFTPKPLVKVRDFDQGPSLDDVLPRGEPNPVVWVVRDGASADSMPFNPRTDLILVALVAAQPMVLVVPAR